MKKQTNQTTKAHLIRGAFYLLLLSAMCAIPFALAQRNEAQRTLRTSAPATRLTLQAPHAQGFTNAFGSVPKTAVRVVPALPAPAGLVCPATITESTSQQIVSGNSVACNDGVGTTENHYWRAFDMNTFTGGQEYDITSVSFGIELASSGSGNGQPLTVNLYAENGAPFPDGTLTLLATSGTINIPDQQLTIFTVPLIATVPAGTLELVMEVTTPDGTAAGNEFFIGSNAAPETGPSYLSAADCGVPDPTPTGELGFPDMHIVFNVNGSCPAGTATPTATPSSTGSPTATPSATPSTTGSPTGTPSATPSATASPSATPSGTPSATGSPTASATATPSGTISPTATPSASGSPSATPSGTPSGTPSATATPSGTPSGCVRGQGYWKNHPEVWPVTELQLGNVTYTQQQLLDILHQPVRGNGLVILARQLIAAELNIAAGADPSCIEEAIAEANALIGDLVIPPVGTGYLPPREAAPLAGILGRFNEGHMCAPSCEQEPPPRPSATPTATGSPSTTPSGTPSATGSPTASATATPSGTISPTATPSATPSATGSPTATPSVTPSATGSPTASATATPSGTISPTATPSATPSATGSPTATPSGTPSATGSPTASPTATPSGTISPTATPSATPSATGSPSATATVTPSGTPSATATPTGTPSATATPSGTPGVCVRGQGYWKNHPEAWPVTELQLGNVTYTQQELLDILHDPVRGNGLLILAHQLIAAKLNIAAGADPTCIEETIAEADALIGDLVIPPVGNGYLAPRDAAPLAGLLGRFNEGGMCAPSCDHGPRPTMTPTPGSRPQRGPRP